MAEGSVIDRITNLSPEQAQRAALAVYEDLPDEAFDGDDKLPLEDLTAHARLMRAGAPEEVSAAVEQLLGPGAEEFKGHVARALLVDLAAQPGVADVVGGAVDAVQQPDMLPIPLIVGAVLIYLARLKTKEQTTTTVDPDTGAQTTTTTVERQNLKWLAELTGNASDLVGKLHGS
jgi:hypothetical protein